MSSDSRTGRNGRVRRELRNRRASFLNVFCLGLTLVCLSTTVGCGKTGDPLPPIRIIPKKTTDLKVIQRGPELWVEFAYPTTTAAGTALPGLDGFTVWATSEPARIGAPILPPAPAQFASQARPLLEVGADDIGSFVFGDRIRARTSLPTVPAGGGETGQLGAYVSILAIRTSASGGEVSDFSNLVSFAPRQESQDAPTELEAEGRPAGVVVRWSYPEPDADQSETTGTEDGNESTRPTGAVIPDPSQEKVDGFRIYRRSAGSRAFGQPLRTVPATGRTFVDRSAVLGQKYIYGVTAVLRRRPVVVESGLGGEVAIDYRDRFPPSQPTGLVALAEAGSIRLVWSGVEDDDLAGYRVYRLTDTGNQRRLLTESLIGDTEFVDRSPGTAGETVRYVVVSVDADGNESEASAAARATAE